jgi:hypothetical protein
MKKAVTIAAIAALCVGKSFAQVPNSIFVMGTGLYDNTYRDGNIGIGYQFDKNWTVGLLGGTSRIVSYSKSNQFGAFARYTSYFSNSEHFFWFAQAQGQYYNSIETPTSSRPYDKKRTGLLISSIAGMGVHFGRGYSANISPLNLRYNVVFSDNYDPYYKNYLSLQLNFRPEITLSKNISWKKRKSAPQITEIAK